MTRFLQRLSQRADWALILLAALVSVLVYVNYNASVDGEASFQEADSASAAAVEVEAGSEEMLPPANRREPVRFLMYNVKDYFVEKDPPRAAHTRRLKPRAQKEAVAQVIASVKPDIIGLVEIGGKAALDDLAERLAARGLEYPYRMALERMGENRALAILSHYPIVADHSVANCKLAGQSNSSMLRGILDVVVELPDKRRFCIMGAHLKSQVSDMPSAAAARRAREARTLAAHIAAATKSRRGMPILVYGDWNDNPNADTLSVLTHGMTKESSLRRLTPQDENGEQWTIYYKDGCIYNTFDQIYVNPVLSTRIGRKSKMGITPQPSGFTPSDHRAVWCDIY